MAKNFKPYKKPFFSKNNLPSYGIDNSAVNKLFSIIPSGNYDKIFKFISSNNISYNVKNDKGESPIHVILDTSESILKKKDKLKLIYFF